MSYQKEWTSAPLWLELYPSVDNERWTPPECRCPRWNITFQLLTQVSFHILFVSATSAFCVAYFESPKKEKPAELGHIS